MTLGAHRKTGKKDVKIASKMFKEVFSSPGVAWTPEPEPPCEPRGGGNRARDAWSALNGVNQ